MMRLLGLIFPAVLLLGCSNLPFFSGTPTPVNTLSYDAPVSFTIKIGTLLPGTSISYNGKSDTGAAKILLAGLLAPKQIGDTVDWTGAPTPNVNVRLNTRVLSFDAQAITLAGTAHVEITNIKIQAGGTPRTALIEFSAPVTFSLKPNEAIPGSIVAYVGSTPNGAQFLGVDGYPYRNQGDSLQYVGHVAPQVFLKLDLRVVSYSDSGIALLGTATIRLEQ